MIELNTENGPVLVNPAHIVSVEPLVGRDPLMAKVITVASTFRTKENYDYIKAAVAWKEKW